MLTAFSLHAADHGYRVTEPLLPDGKIHRVSWSPQSKNKSGWYVAWDHGDWHTVAWGDWKDSWQEVWTSRAARSLSTADRAAVKAHVDAVKAIEAAERAKAMKVAEFWADRIWKDAAINPENHPYLAKKQIPGKALRIWERDGKLELLVPLRDEHGSLSNLQRILEDGTKRFIRGAGIVGLHWRTGRIPDDVEFSGDLVVAEGVATAATVHKLSGATVFAAMNAGNLPAIVSWVRKTWPIARILIAADDDRWERDGTARPEEKNMGRKKAAEAAAGTRALIILPTWTDLQSRGTDWNDLYCEEGEIGAMVKWRSALAIAALDRQISILTDSEYAQRRASLIAAYANAGAARMGTRQLDQRRQERRGEAPGGNDNDPDRPPIMDLMRIVDDYELWHDQIGTAYCTMQNRGVWMNAQVEGQLFDDWLRTEYEERTGNSTPLLPQTTKTMATHAAAKARTVGPKHPSYYRLGKCANYRWLDLGRDDWKCVRWNAEGWEIVDTAGVKFFRGEDNSALPLPVRDPSINGLDPFWKIINTPEENRPLLAGFLLGALKSDTPCFGLSLQGEQGSAKSVATELIRSMIDPTTTPFQRLNDVKPEDFGTTCVTQWIPCFDNISGIDPEMQDVMCSLTTGFGFKTRKLYTNSSVVSCWVRRPWIINSITNVCSRSDLAERSIPVHLNVIDKRSRKTEDDVRGEFKLLHPHLLAIMLDAAVEAERHMEAAGAAIKKSGMSHRMADALQWITAGEDAMGFAGGTFLTRLDALQEECGVDALEGTPMMDTIEALLAENSRGEWVGTTPELLKKLEDFSPVRGRPKYIPSDERSLGNYFKRESPRLLRSFGIKVSDSKPNLSRYGDNKRRRIIQKIDPQIEF